MKELITYLDLNTDHQYRKMLFQKEKKKGVVDSCCSISSANTEAARITCFTVIFSILVGVNVCW
jgi:hypothetical protein